jgi:hypothetical protein
MVTYRCPCPVGSHIEVCDADVVLQPLEEQAAALVTEFVEPQVELEQ